MKETLGTLCLLLAPLLSMSQQPPSCVTPKLAKDKPTVYITFERLGKALDLSQQRMLEESKASKTENGNDVWLRVHNNTCWRLDFAQFSMFLPKAKPGEDMKSRILRMDGVLEEGAETGLYYWVVSKKEPPVFIGIDSSNAVTLLPGNSLVFSVPREHLSKDKSVRVNFHFEWEDIVNEPRHSIEYRNYEFQEELKGSK